MLSIDSWPKKVKSLSDQKGKKGKEEVGVRSFSIQNYLTTWNPI